MRAGIALGRHECFTCIFNIETETWQERDQFMTSVAHFGLVLHSGRLFVIGGGNGERNNDGKDAWECRYDVRYAPLQNLLNGEATEQDSMLEWKIHGKLPKPCRVHA